MNYFLQSQSLANIIDCLCQLFAEPNNTDYQSKVSPIETNITSPIPAPDYHLQVSQIKTNIANLIPALESLLNIPHEELSTDPCENAHYLLKLLNQLWFNNIDVPPKDEEGNPLADYFASILDLFGEIMGNSTVNPCEGSEPFDAGLKLNASCICRMLGLLSKMEGEANSVIQALNGAFNDLKTAVEEKTADLLFSSYVLTGDICDQAKQMDKLLKSISLRNDLVDDLIPLYDQFKNKAEEAKTSLSNLGIYPCDNEIDLGGDNLYIQAAGSKGIDGSVQGVHLRWTFMNELAEKHIPKGTLSNSGSPYYTNIGHNKEDDFIKIFKIPYDQATQAKICIELISLTFADVNEIILANSVIWNIDYEINGAIEKIRFNFIDAAAYNIAKNMQNGSPAVILNNYTEILEISILNRTLFAAEYHFTNVSGATNQYEAISEYSKLGESDTIVSSRLQDDGTIQNDFVKRIVNENIVILKLKRGGTSELIKICLESYHDFYYKNLDNIHPLGQYALTVTDSVAYNRLEDTSRFTIDKLWPSFNNDVAVKTSSYKNKWDEQFGGLKLSVEKYLSKSKTDLLAIDNILSEDPNDDSTFELSFLDVLNIAASDFHFSRMLGMGEIDETVTSQESFIYMAEYKKKVEGSNEELPLLNFTLPTAQSDQRLPSTPVLNPIEYGFTPQNDDSDNLIKIDTNGYAAYGDIRFVRLNKAKYPYEEAGLNFFENGATFDTGIITKPLRFGIEYKNHNNSSFVKPEITADLGSLYPNFDNSTGLDIAENDPVVESDNALFVHQESMEGKHDYAIYGINWFNRISTLSAIKSTDNTSFPLRESLLPPSKTQILLLQSDLTDLLVSTADLLAFQDKLRVKFDWNHLHNINYLKANKVEFFHRIDAPKEIRGRITSVTLTSSGDKFDIQTSPYERKSVDPIETIKPTIANTSVANKFIGGKLFIGSKPYTIVSISNFGDDPIIQVEGDEIITKSFDSEQPKKIILSKSYEGPKPGTFFSALENLNNETNWNKLNKVIDIVHFGSSPYTETEVDSEGQTRVLTIGGIAGNANISKFNTDPDSKLYLIEFPSKSLSSHPQELSEKVFWSEGITRIKLTNETLELKVVQYITTSNPLKIVVLNNTAVTLPSNADVNFHPSYLLYVDKETTSAFKDNNLLPLSGEMDRKTYFSLRSIDDAESPVLKSDLAKPIELNSHKVYIPMAPAKPQGASFATRPDTYGKSTYSFDSEVETNGRSPYGMMFLKANEDSILRVLYKNLTIIAIKDNLEAIAPDDFHSNRFSELVNVVLDSSGEFIEYNNYRFPEPDIDDITGLSPSAKMELLKKRIDSVFVPLTAEPVIYDKVKIGYQTKNTTPVIRDEKGKLLLNSDPNYNPYPMIRKFQDTTSNEWNVRFTDYDLDGAANNEYFYFSREIDLNYQFGIRSLISGPIQLINSKPPRKPEIVSVITLLADAQLSLNTRIEFTITPYKTDNIQKMRIFRTMSSAKAGNVSLMKMVKEVTFSTSVFDDLSDLPNPPFGELIYYRIVALRELINEQGAIEYIPSIPSDLIETQLIDENNPIVPIITATSAVNPASSTMDNVSLKWSKTVHNGTYYIYKMSNSGTWQKIHEISSNDETFDLPLVSTDLGSSSLDKTDAGDNIIYYRFKIDVENSSGLMNLNEEIITFSNVDQSTSGISFNGTEGMAIGSTFIIK